jgi:ubiquinone/menaquinone biosynthesis C-methylase UbiE
MGFDSKKIEDIYAGNVARRYDFSMPPFFAKWKKKAFNDSSLKKGDRVLVFCCGTGLDFPHILKKIGKDGKIVGVDFSSEMLKNSRNNIEKNGWENIELVQADITKFEENFEKNFDVGVCTLGMSIIPEYKSAFRNLCSYVKDEGEIIIGDMQLASGGFARLNPITVFFAKKYGGTHEGHQNSVELYSIMKKEFAEVRKREFFFKSYYYCIGRKK